MLKRAAEWPETLSPNHLMMVQMIMSGTVQMIHDMSRCTRGGARSVCCLIPLSSAGHSLSETLSVCQDASESIASALDFRQTEGDTPAVSGNVSEWVSH